VVESDVETLFLDMKNAFLASQSIIGIEGTRKKTMQSLIAEASVIEQTHANTIAISEFYAKMEGVLLPVVEKEGWEQTIAISPEEIVRHIMEVISFFRAGKKENIWYLIDSIIYPEVELIEQEYGDQAKEQESSDQTALSAPPIGKEPTQPSLQTIITTAKNMDVNNPEAILSYLDEQATALGDDQIRDLYYYDEQTGVFAWNTDVLSNGNNG